MWSNTQPIDTKLSLSDGASWAFGPEQALPQAANDLSSLSLPPGLPPGATAIIHKPGRSATSSGKTRACEWVLRFQPVSAQFIEPLMGWCGGDDPLRHVELRFPSREAAVGFAARHGIPYEVSEPPPEQHARARCPDDTVGLWRQWMLECLGTFEAGAEWWGNAGPDQAVIATLDRWEQNARSLDAAERAADTDGGASRPDKAWTTQEASSAPMIQPVPANADVRREPAGVSVA